MNITAYVAHLSYEEMKKFLPLRELFRKFVKKKTRNNYRRILHDLIYGGDTIEYVPAFCVGSIDEMYCFAQEILRKMDKLHI